MACRIEAGSVVDMGRNVSGVDFVELAQEGDEIAASTLEIVDGRVHFRAVAGRDHHRFPRDAARRNCLERAVDTARLKVDALAQLDGRGAVTDSDQEQMHPGLVEFADLRM